MHSFFLLLPLSSLVLRFCPFLKNFVLAKLMLFEKIRVSLHDRLTTTESEIST